MTIRPATISDAEALADLAHEHRIRRQGWDPEFWSMSPAARQIHPMLLRVSIAATEGLCLVSENAGRLDGYLIASLAPDPRGPRGMLWVVDDLAVESSRGWHSIAPTLLAAAASRRRESDASAMVIGCPHGDRDRARMLIASGFAINCWFRTRRVATGRAVGAVEDSVPTEDLPMPHLHGLSAALLGATSVRLDGGGAVLSAPIAPHQMSADRTTSAIADPVVGDSTATATALLDEIERECATRGDSMLIVACGPGEPMLDTILDEHGFARPVDWHALQW